MPPTAESTSPQPDTQAVQPHISEVMPAVHEKLQNLPLHLIEHVGESALRLSHIDMHPTEEVKGNFETFTQPDYNTKITDPGFDEATLEAGAVEAAHAGKEKLEHVLHHGSSLLSLAHESLIAQGHTFEAQDNESDTDRQARTEAERTLIFNTAQELAVSQALALKEAGDSAAAQEALEAFNILVTLHNSPTNTAIVNRSLRQLVHEGMAQDVLNAARESVKIAEGATYGSDAASHVSRAKELLSMSLGKNIQYNFKEEGEFTVDRIHSIVGPEGVANILAVITGKGDMPEDKRNALLDKLQNYSVYELIRKHTEGMTSLQDAKYIYDLDETCIAAGTMPTETFAGYLAYDNPQVAYNLVAELGLDMYKFGAMFSENNPDKRHDRIIKTEAVALFKDMIAMYPHYKDSIVADLTGTTTDTLESLSKIQKGIHALEPLGITDPSLVTTLRMAKEPESVIESGNMLAEYLKNQGMQCADLALLLTDTKTFSVGALLSKLAEVAPAERQNMLELRIIEASITKTYLAKYKSLRYPATRKSMMTTRSELGESPLIAARLQNCGLDSETATAIYASWATFSKLSSYAYNLLLPDGVSRLEFGDLKRPEDADLAKIAQEQAEAFMQQLKAIEQYNTEYGAEELQSVINIFGIYNFNRNKLGAIHRQMQQWESGKPIKNVVVKARSDWNSYADKTVNFDDPEGEGVFVFEANSATETSRIAVAVGRYERSHGREPNVERFIIDAHGNATGMLMGVNGELIDTTMYTAAARDRKKINGSEVNDYRRHLGEEFSVILKSCSTAGDTYGKNMANTMAEQHRTEVVGSKVTITSLTIDKNGDVIFESSNPKADASPQSYDYRS